MQAQARICPTCHDDHWPDRSCKEHDLKDRIATLEAKLVEAERTIAELRSINAGKVESDGRHLKALAEIEAERDEARRVAVWAVRKEARVFWEHMDYQKPLLWKGQHPYQNTLFTIGTDADIYRALKEAMKGVEIIEP